MGRVVIEIDGYSYSAEIDGERRYGTDEVLLLADDNLIAGTPWASRGFTVARFLDAASYHALVGGITDVVREVVAQHMTTDLNDFTLDQYHRYVSSEVHQQVVRETVGGLAIDRLPIPVRLIERRISELCGTEVCADAPYLDSPLFYIRIVRPGVETDNNPPHRDAWLDHLRNCVNLYVPIAGSNARSALPVVPGSHLWKESEIERTSEGALIGGQSYRVPSVTGAVRSIRMVRPNPGPNELTLFSPYLVHGGGINLNPDTTRVSLEMRFWRRVDK